MKPKIDLSDPQNQKWLHIFNQRRALAWKAAMKLNDAIRSVFFHFPGKQHPEQTGTCVLLHLNGSYFVLSAAHVLEDCGKHQIQIGCGAQLHAINGERFSTVPGPSGAHRDDPADVAVVHIQGEVPAEIKESSASLSDLDFSALTEPRSFFITKGFRAQESWATGNTAWSTLESFGSVEYPDKEYLHMGINRDHQIALAYEEELLVDGKLQNSPIPKGMSGGAMIRIRGVPMDPQIEVSPAPTPRIAAILIEYHPRGNDTKPRLIGARVQHHLRVISRHMPETGTWIQSQLRQDR